MLDDLYQAGTDAAIADLIQRPPTPKAQPAKFSAWRTLTAVPRAVGAGSNETAGGVADMIGAFGQVMGGSDNRSSMFSAQTEDQRKQEEDARRKMLKQGLELDTGDTFRATAREWMPDPATAHTAEKTVFGIVRFGTKAVTAVATAGPVAGSGLVGLDEALTTADELKQQGVDAATRMEVGAVAGVTSALGVALPVAGKTAAQTAALVGVGGPGSFMAQQAATREILKAADYSQLADQYDPLDPVGLAVSTLVPAGFGMWAMRGARAKAPHVGEVKPGEAAPPEMRPDGQPVQDAAQSEPSRPRPTPDQVDAARVEMLTQHIESAGLHSASDARAAAMHLDAFARAMDDLGAGRRVDVTDLVPMERIQMAKAMDTFATRLDESRAELMAQAAQRAEPGAVRALQSELIDAQARLAEFEDPAAIKARAGELQQAERMSYKQALTQAKREFSTQADDIRARIARVEGLLEDNATGQQAFDALNLLDRQAADVGRKRSQIDAPATVETPTAQAVREITATRQEATANVQDAPQAGKDAPAGAARQSEPAAQPQAADARGTAPAGAAEQGGGVPRAGGSAPEAAAVAARLAEVSQQFPDLTVQMDGMDAPMRLSDFLDQVRREAMEGTDLDIGGNDAPLMQVAASCFLLNGA